MFASNYLLNQADIGMGCALGTGGGMVKSLVAAYAPPDVRDHVLAKFESGEWEGETAQLLTERTGGSDLGALETTATRDGDAWRLNGFKWFASNCNGEAFVVLAKPEGAPDSTRGVATFLVLRTRRDGSRNGVRVRRLKDKLGTRSVASGEIEFVDAEAFLLSGEASDDAGPADGKGLGRMMELTNAARLGIALFALGNARRALVESLCYARQRQAFGDALIDKPLMRRKLAEMIVDVEAAQALVFDGTGAANHRQPRRVRQRIAVPVTKLKVCRLGITMASDAIEIHGGNGYIETWPVARLLRDAQVNTIWEGPTTSSALTCGGGSSGPRRTSRCWRVCTTRCRCPTMTTRPRLVSRRVEDLDAAITAWTKLDGAVAEARLFPLTQFMGDVYAGALLTEQAAWERAERQTDRKALVARLYAQRYLADLGRFAASTPRATRRSSVSTSSRRARWRSISWPSNTKVPDTPGFWGPLRLLAQETERHRGRHRRGAVGDAELVERPQQMGFHGRLADVQLTSDVGVGLALGDLAEHFDFARRQRRRTGLPDKANQAIRDRRREHGLATGGVGHRFGQLGARRVLQQVSGCAGLDRAQDVGVGFVGGDDDDPCPR